MKPSRTPKLKSNTNRSDRGGIVRFLFVAVILSVGLLRSDATARQPQTFPSGNGAWALASDGANIWVTDDRFFNGTVAKIRASDGVLLGIFNVGSEPEGITFDGANIWVSNRASNTVTKLRASDGAVLGTFTVGNGPYGMTFDGENVWVANWNDSTVTKIRPNDGEILATNERWHARRHLPGSKQRHGFARYHF